MALHTKSGNVIPKDAVILTRDDAIRFQGNIINSWKNTGDVFFLRYGGQILCSAAGAMGLYLNLYYRHRLRLLHYGRMSTYVSSVVVPFAATGLLHVKLVQEPILIERFQCPLCMELKSICVQVMGGVIYPMVLAPLVNFMMATKYYTYTMPDVTRDPRGTLKILKKFNSPMITTFLGLSALQVAIAAFVAYKEIESVQTVKRKLTEMEMEFDGEKVY